MEGKAVVVLVAVVCALLLLLAVLAVPRDTSGEDAWKRSVQAVPGALDDLAAKVTQLQQQQTAAAERELLLSNTVHALLTAYSEGRHDVQNLTAMVDTLLQQGSFSSLAVQELRVKLALAQPGYAKAYDKYKALIKELSEVWQTQESLEGHSGQFNEQVETYQKLAMLPGLKTVCETGFNAGHSAAAMLTASPTVHVYSFDIAMHTYTKNAANLLLSKFPGRFNITYGDSKVSLPEFHKANPTVRCDFTIVDGDHSYAGALKDMAHFYELYVNPKSEWSLVVMDDYDCKHFWCTAPYQVFNEYAEKGLLKIIHTASSTVESLERSLALGLWTK